jgi:hypothetical protein
MTSSFLRTHLSNGVSRVFESYVPPYTLAGFDLTTHNSSLLGGSVAGGDDFTTYIYLTASVSRFLLVRFLDFPDFPDFPDFRDFRDFLDFVRIFPTDSRFYIRRTTILLKLKLQL